MEHNSACFIYLSLSLYIYYNLNDSLTLFNMRLCVNNRLKPALKCKLFVFVAKFSFFETQLEVKFSETNRIFWHYVVRQKVNWLNAI